VYQLYAGSLTCEDGRSQRLFRGRLANFYRLPPGSPTWGFTAHVGGRAPS